MCSGIYLSLNLFIYLFINFFPFATLHYLSIIFTLLPLLNLLFVGYIHSPPSLYSLFLPILSVTFRKKALENATTATAAVRRLCSETGELAAAVRVSH